MTDYPFRMQLAEDASPTGNVARNAAITFYDPSDTGLVSPLVLKDPLGLPFPNPASTTDEGFVKAFVAQVPEVMWVGGDKTGFMTSFEGLKASAEDAATQAASSAVAAAQALDAANAAAQTAGTEAAAVASTAVNASASAASTSAAAAANALTAALAAQAAAEAAAAAAAGASGGAAIQEDTANPGLYFAVAGGQLTADPANPGLYLV